MVRQVLNECLHLCVAYLVKINGLLLEHGNLWRMDGDHGWLEVAAFTGSKYNDLRRREKCINRNGNWLAVLEDNNSFNKMKMEDLAVDYGYFYARVCCLDLDELCMLRL